VLVARSGGWFVAVVGDHPHQILVKGLVGLIPVGQRHCVSSLWGSDEKRPDAPGMEGYTDGKDDDVQGCAVVLVSAVGYRAVLGTGSSLPIAKQAGAGGQYVTSV